MRTLHEAGYVAFHASLTDDRIESGSLLPMPGRELPFRPSPGGFHRFAGREKVMRGSAELLATNSGTLRRRDRAPIAPAPLSEAR